MSIKHTYKLVEQQVRNLVRTLPEGNFAIPQLVQTLNSFEQLTDFLSNNNFKLAFIGAVGVGKTTALSSLLGLLDQKGKPLLAVSSGRTTLCEVVIRKSDALKIEIDPLSDLEVKEYLKDYAFYLYQKANSDLTENDFNVLGDDSEEFFKLSSEIDRALKNMLYFGTKTVDKDGEKTHVDLAKEFAKDHNSPEALYEQLLDRFKLNERTKTRFYPTDNISSDEWLKKTFRDINHGKLCDVSLPKKITIDLNVDILGITDYDIQVIDTKGLDQTVVREDLEKCIRDSSIVSVLCSRFTDAPSYAVTDMIKKALDAGISRKRIEEEFIILVLDRDEEAENIDDGDGAVEDKAIGRQIRKEQVLEDLKHKYGLKNIKLAFYDSKMDKPIELIKYIKETFDGIVKSKKEQWDNTKNTIDILSREAKGGTLSGSRKQLKATLEVWLKEASCHSPVLKQYYISTINKIDITNASSIRASVNRRGEWQKYNVYEELAVSARASLVKQLTQFHQNLNSLLNNMKQQDDLKPIHAIIQQLSDMSEDRINEIYTDAYIEGKDLVQTPLYYDVELWKEIQNEWGKGPGYKMRVKKHIQDWFETNDRYLTYDTAITSLIEKQWKEFLNEINDMIQIS